MIRQEEVIQFFDRLAGSWDADMIRNDDVIRKILDNAGVTAGVSVLDVACGTGVLFPDYLARNVKSVTGVDVSPEMAKIASEKFRNNETVRVVCADVEQFTSETPFDVVMVYNAFPHFPDPERLIRNLAGFLPEGGRLSIAHGMSREAINAHHSGTASHVSNGLMPADELAGLFEPWFDAETVIDDGQMYQVTGRKK